MSAGRSSFSLPPPASLRDRTNRVNDKAGRKARPRRRYLADQQHRMAARLVPTIALAAALTGTVIFLDSLSRPSSMATVAGASLAIVLAACSLLVPVARKSLDALLILGSCAAIATLVGWGLIAHLTGGAASPYLLVIPLGSLAITSLVPIPPRVAAISGVASYVGLLLASPFSPPYAHILVLGTGGAGVVLARARHKAGIMVFMRVERLSAAVSRMRRLQEQLVVVEKLEALRVLVGGMAHELNNALAISVASNQQATKALATDREQALGALKRSDGGLARVRRTVDRLRRFAMAAEGVLEPADVGAMLDFALESAIGRARSGVIIQREYDPAVGAIECHVAALAEALFQIARNAVEAMPGDGTILASVRNEGDRVVLSVADEGRGIPAAELAKVFDPFYSRGPGAAKSGLGLSAVYGLVSALGGKVEINSTEGKGTEVAIIMPKRQSGGSRPPPAPPSVR